jgi:hypothetical protein
MVFPLTPNALLLTDRDLDIGILDFHTGLRTGLRDLRPFLSERWAPIYLKESSFSW